MPFESDIFTPKAARDRIAAIDAEITALQQSIVDLQLEKSTLNSHLDALVYPVLTLPNEVVSEVFLRTLPRWPSISIHTVLQSPLLLGRICSKWREISISTPTLWTAIDIWLDRVPVHDHDNKLRLLELWLTRSCNCPLFISIMAQRPALAHENFAFRLYIEAIMPHCRRWESLHLTVPFNDLPVICGEFPLLQSLVINMPDADEHAHAAPVHVFVEAPKLRGLLLLPMPSPTQIIFPWAQMSVMSIHTNFAQRLLTVLPLIVNVTDLTIKLQSFEAALTEDTPDIPPFPQLRALRLPGTDGFGSRTVTRLLQKLTLPSLCLLDADAISLPPRAIKALLSRSRCHRPSFKLAIRRSAFTEADYRKVLRKVGTIVVLEPADGGIDFFAESIIAEFEPTDEATEESDGDVGEESEQSSNEDP